MEKSIFLEDEKDCLAKIKNGVWNVSQQPIICYLNSQGIDVYRLGSAPRLFKNMPFEICKIAGINPFFDSVVEIENQIVLKSDSQDYKINAYKASMISSLASLCNSFLKSEKFIVLTINYNKVVFFKASIVFIEELMNFIEETNQTIVKTNTFKNYELIWYEHDGKNTDSRLYKYCSTQKKAILNALECINIVEEIEQTENKILEFDFLYKPFIKELKRNKISNFYKFNLSTHFEYLAVARFLTEIEEIFELPRNTFQIKTYGQSDNIKVGIKEIEYEIKKDEREVFAFINRILESLGKTKQIYGLATTYENLNEKTQKFYLKISDYNHFIILANDEGKMVFEKLQECYLNLNARTFSDVSIINRHIEFYNLNTNIDFNWKTVMNQCNLVYGNFEKWNPRYYDWADGLGMIGIAVWQLSHEYYNYEKFMDEFLIKTGLKDKIQIETNRQEYGIAYEIKYNYKTRILNFVDFPDVTFITIFIKELNKILVEIGEDKHLHYVNESLIFAKWTISLDMFLKICAFDKKFDYKTDFLSKIYHKYKFILINFANYLLKLNE